VPIDQDHIPAPFLQVQGGADADHARPQDDDVGLHFRHPALRKFNVTRMLPLTKVKLIIAAEPRKPVNQQGNRACAAGKLWQHATATSAACADRLSINGEQDQMSSRQSLFAAASACFVAFAYLPASAQTLRYANQGDLKSLDPYTLNESTTRASRTRLRGLVAPKNLKSFPPSGKLKPSCLLAPLHRA
jgi:hypothetical protein